MTGELGNKIDSLWEIFWNGGITNQVFVKIEKSNGFLIAFTKIGWMYLKVVS